MEISIEFNGNRKTVKSEDENGKYGLSVSGYRFPIVKGVFQITIENEDDHAYINVYKSELLAIRELIDEAIKNLNP